MAEFETARLSGRVFCWSSSFDQGRMALEALRGPLLPKHLSADFNDDVLSLDEDESLPWSGMAKVQTLWARQISMHAAAAAGQVFFEGEMPSFVAALAPHCLQVSYSSSLSCFRSQRVCCGSSERCDCPYG